jgi:rubrerythrin
MADRKDGGGMSERQVTMWACPHCGMAVSDSPCEYCGKPYQEPVKEDKQ